MAITFQNRRGTSSQNDNFTGAQGEIVVDTTNEEIRLHNGVKQGGKILGGMPNEDTIASFRLMERTPEYIYVKAYDSSGNTDGAFGSNFFRLATDTGQVDNGGTIIRTVNGVYELQYSGAVNVKWFGAKGDANYESLGIYYSDSGLTIPSTDDSAAIQAAITGNDNIHFPNGTFLVETEIEVAANKTLSSTIGGLVTAGVGLQVANAPVYVFKITGNHVTFNDMSVSVDYNLFPDNPADQAKVGCITASGLSNLKFINCTLHGAANKYQATGFQGCRVMEFLNTQNIFLLNCNVGGDYVVGWGLLLLIQRYATLIVVLL